MEARSPAILTFKPNPAEHRQRSRKDSCVYCGGVATTKDHVIPRTLYTGDDAKNLQLQTVSACSFCNGLKSLFDEPLRDFLAIDVDSSQHVKTKTLFDAVERAAKQKQLRMLDRFYDGKTVPLFDREGKFDTLGWQVPMDDDFHIQAVNWITRGIHWVVFGERSSIQDVKSSMVDRYSRHDFMLKGAVAGAFQGHFKQGEQYGCAFGQTPAGDVYWWHVFFDTVLVVSKSKRSILYRR